MLALILAACAGPVVVVGGTLAVSVSGLPASVDAAVTVSGPDGFSEDLTGFTVLTDLAPGAYSATAGSVSDGSSSYAPTISGSPAEVTATAAAGIEVAYVVVPGSLEVTIAGLPGGLDADVVVEGANCFSTVVASSTTLTGLAPGLYQVTSPVVRIPDPIVSRAYAPRDPAATAVEVVSGAAATVEASYAAIPSSGRLWTPHFGPTIATGFAASDLVVSGSPSPLTVVTSNSQMHNGMAFDATGSVWISNQTSDTIERYQAVDLATDGKPLPRVVVGGLNDPAGLAFDADGNLWVANITSSTVVMFAPEQLLTSGSPTPTVTLTANVGSLAGPMSIAFDASGSLWVANFSGDTVVRFGASQLLSSGSPAPEATIGDDGGGNLASPTGLAFDASGDLWVTNYNGPDALLKFESPERLSGPVAPTPSAVLTGLADPLGVAFDNSGALWVALWPTANLHRFDAPELLEGAVSPAADAVIQSAAESIVGLIALFPPPEDVPIHTP